MSAARWCSCLAALLLSGLLSGSLPRAAGADALMVTRAATASTIAEFFVEEDAVRVELEIGVDDLAAFRNLLPDLLFERLGNAPEPWLERLERFFAHDLVIRADDSGPLPGRVREIAGRQRLPRDELTGELLPAKEGEAETVVFAVLEYPFEGHPSTLTLSPAGVASGAAPANVGFVVYHLGLPVIDFRYLGADAVLDLDWVDPWYSRFRARNMRRRYDAPLNAFLYVEPYEVRSEIVAQPLDLQRWVDLGLEGRRTIPVDMQEELRSKAAGFLAAHAAVTIDGKKVEPTLERVHFLRRTLRSSTVVDPPEELDVLSATLGVIFSYPTLGLPQEATLTWDLFGPRIERVPAAATDEAGPLPTFLTVEDPVLRWQNFLRNPTLPTRVELASAPRLPVDLLAGAAWLAVLALGGVVLRCAAAARRGRPLGVRQGALVGVLLVTTLGAFAGARAGRIDASEAETIVGGLLHNVYRAFDFRDESTIYDTLAESVSGDLLTQIYVETQRGLVIASQGGARARVKEVSLVEVEALPLDAGSGFRARCIWNVRGAVGHWGHIHQRTNRYEALLRIEPLNGVWKITDLTLLEEERV